LASQSFQTSGVVGGLQVGYNYLLNRNWLVGLETDFDGSGMRGSGTSVSALGITSSSVDEQIKWFGTVRARVGYLPTDNLLTYVTGGFAYGKVEQSGSLVVPTGFIGLGVGLPFAATCTGPATCLSGSSSEVATGWTLGGGVEYPFWQKWTVKAEYLYVSLNSQATTENWVAVLTPGTTVPSYNASSRTSFNILRAGLNYRF
jgi:outer membrane immunogenic protein